MAIGRFRFGHDRVRQRQRSLGIVQHDRAAANRHAFAQLARGIYERRGLLLLSGVSQSGKTRLLTRLMREAPADLNYLYCSVRELDFDQLLTSISADLQLPCATAGRPQKLKALKDYFCSDDSERVLNVLIVDDVTHFNRDTMNYLLVLFQSIQKDNSSLQLILSGTPDLESRLSTRKPVHPVVKQAVCARLTRPQAPAQVAAGSKALTISAQASAHRDTGTGLTLWKARPPAAAPAAPAERRPSGWLLAASLAVLAGGAGLGITAWLSSQADRGKVQISAVRLPTETLAAAAVPTPRAAPPPHAAVTIDKVAVSAAPQPQTDSAAVVVLHNRDPKQPSAQQVAVAISSAQQPAGASAQVNARSAEDLRQVTPDTTLAKLDDGQVDRPTAASLQPQVHASPAKAAVAGAVGPPTQPTSGAPAKLPIEVPLIATVGALQLAPSPARRVQDDGDQRGGRSVSSPGGAATASMVVSAAAEPTPIDDLNSTTAARPELIDAQEYLRRGQELLGLGDIASARLLFEAGAATGHGGCLFSVGKTYDPILLRELGVMGIYADSAAALNWYAEAVQAGHPEAATRADTLRTSLANRAP